jgi:hypothetical protein
MIPRQGSGLTRGAVVAVLVFLWLAGTLRACLIWMHDPLYAYANSYDQTRYTACFRFYPDRAPDVAPELNSPEAPYSHFRFMPTGEAMCYWSSELAFGGATALIWKSAELFGGGRVHDARWVGTLRWLALLAVSIAFSRAWLVRGNARAALANAALVPLVFADPGNTLYLSTFYAEWTALLAVYALAGLVLLWRGEARSRRRFVLLALAAFVLATSKIQHMLLPLALGLAWLMLDRARLGRMSWRAAALLSGAFLGAYFQFVQIGREGLMMDTIRQYNRADVVFTALVPFAEDPRALLEEIGIDPACARYAGKPAWQLPDLPQRACPGLVNFTRGREIGALLRHPPIAVAIAVRGVRALDPWLADNIGHVEGQRFAKLPASVPTVGRVLHAHPAVQLVLLALPLVVLAFLLVRPRLRAGAASLEATALVVVTMTATLGVTLLGDGLADTAKQGHLVIDAALAWLVAGLMMCAPAGRRSLKQAADALAAPVSPTRSRTLR